MRLRALRRKSLVLHAKCQGVYQAKTLEGKEREPYTSAAMTRTLDQSQERRESWIRRVQALADQVAKWSEAKGWKVQREETEIEEEGIGKYHVPAIRVFLPKGELFLDPRALDVLGTFDGRVDLSVYPTMSRVKLLGIPGGWEIMTQSNIPLRKPWNQKTFVQVVEDMLGL